MGGGYIATSRFERRACERYQPGGGQQRFYGFDLPAGQVSARGITHGDSGDIDLYIGVGGGPTTDNVCKSERPSNAETCTISNPAAGICHVLLNGFWLRRAQVSRPHTISGQW